MRTLILLLLLASASGQTYTARMLSGVNYQSGTSYTFVGQDSTRVVAFTNAGSVSATLSPGSTAGFGAGTEYSTQNSGLGTVTIFCNGCTINGVATLTLAPSQGADLYSDGQNYTGVMGGSGGGGSLTGVTAGVGLNGGGTSGVVTLNLDTLLPNGTQCVTQLTGDTSSNCASDAFVMAALASSGLLPQSGCGVESIAGTLQVTVGACLNYTINGTQYSSPLTTVTLAAADLTNPRLDLIGVNTSGAVFVTTGTPAVNPVEPSADPSTQFALTAVLVPANATSPSLTVVDIYHNCGPWTIASVGAPITQCSTANPYNATNPTSVLGTAATTGNYVQFTDLASGTVTLPNYNNLVLYIAPIATWPSTRSLTVQAYNGSTTVGSPVLIGASGTFGFNSSNTNYQQVAIPTALFNTSTAVPTFRITVSGTGGTIGFYIADISLQGGASSGPGGVFMNNSQVWTSTASYNPQNVVTNAGEPYVALQANSNSAPSATNTNWFPLVTVGSNQQVIYNCGGILCGDPGMIYIAATHAFTITGPMTASQYTATGAGAFTITGTEGAAPTGVVGSDVLWADATGHCWKMNLNNGGSTGCIGSSSGTVTSITFSSPLSGGTITTSGTVGINANGITATQLAAQYSKGSCTEVWGGSGTANAMQAGDDAIVNNACYNDSSVTRTITAVKCRSDNAANTTVLTPTMGSAGTGTAILTGTVTCGNSYAYSATGTLSSTSWTTGTGIDPGMSTVGNATSIAMIVEYTY